MKRRYLQALWVGVGRIAAITWSVIDQSTGGLFMLVAGSAAMPVAAVLVVSGRLAADPPWKALIGGGTIGVLIALVSHAFVFGFAYAFFLGFADRAADVLDALRLDPRITALIDSPWTIVLMVELVVVAPLTEEIGKAAGSLLVKLDDRRSAFLAGATAGAGFAIVENVVYAASAGLFGEAWQAVAIARMLGAAVHPLASGIVVLAWWEWRTREAEGRALRQFFLGAGVHALWNGSLVVLAVATTAFDFGGASQSYAAVSLTYSAILGVATAAALWLIAGSVAESAELRLRIDSGDGRVVGAWTVLSASLLVPLAMLLLAFPALGM